MKANQKKGVIAPDNAVLDLEETIYKVLFLLSSITALYAKEIETHHREQTGEKIAAGLICMSYDLQDELSLGYSAAIEQWKRDSRN